MQIPAEYGEDYIVLAISVGLATIGVCIFSAVTSVAALFILFKYTKEKKQWQLFNVPNATKVFQIKR